ncbi:PstS family phosphate ABC transporter substrate-binding protein [Erwinia sp. JUb26]|uniref:PstS family phosphate ABC transporter substrate-binding protein n=1 Tax=Erwinia sp. JUb26 TaxID=2485126 RepID=UPI000F470698|nr:substrate-binding domain-containing protein [Erwinia sp. JUb26]ROR13372.1 phosphate transport system substrate-binding protein [Erwinia sp. JUb26]
MSEFFYITGNDGMASLIEPWCAMLSAQRPEQEFQLSLAGSSTAIMALAADACLLAPMSRAPWAQELAAFRNVKGYLPSGIQVGWCGHGPRAGAKTPPAIWLHRDNPLAGLSMAQLAAVFSSGSPQGDITCWSQLGLGGAWLHRRIHLYGLRDDGKYASAFRRAHLANRPFPRHYEPLPDRRAVLDAVAADPFSLGAVGWFNAAAFGDGVRVLPLGQHEGDFFMPDAEAVQAGNYPLGSAVTLWFDLPPGGVPEPRLAAFLQLVLSDVGQQAVAAQSSSPEGYLPLNPAMLHAQRQRLQQLIDGRGKQ